MSREEGIIYPQCGGIVAFRDRPMAQKADCEKQLNVSLKWTVIKSNREVHLLPPDPIDISEDHFDWNGDFNQATVESDYLRSMLSHLMKGLFWLSSSHYVMLFHAQWYVSPLL